MEEQQKDKLGTAPVVPLIVSLVIPAIIAQFINVLYNVIDRMYIGRIEGYGDKALTGVGVCFPILILIAAFSNLVGAGGAPLAAIQLGKGNHKRAEEMLGSGFACLVFIAVTLTVLFQIIKYPILMAFGASTETVPYAMEYLSVYLWGTIFVQTVLGLNQFITCQGRSKIAMMSVTIGAVINIILDPIFIFGLHMGVRGAGLATVLSQAVSSVWVLSFLSSSRSSIRLRREYIKLDLPILGSIMALGVSPFIMAFTECLINVVFNSGLQKYGGDLYVGSMTIIQSVMQIMTVFSNGLPQGIQPVISFNYGARNIDRVKSAYRFGFMASVTVSTISCLIAVLFPGMFASIFTDNAELIGMVVRKMPIFLAGWWIFGVQMGAQAAFLGMGQAKISLFLACLRKVILLIPLALILPLFCGVDGIYIAEPISDSISAVTAGTLFVLNIKKILEKEPA